MAGELAARIGRNIKLARNELGLNQRQLAQRIDDPAASNVAVSEWERGVRKPSDRYLPLLADALEKPIEWFYVDRDQPTPDLSTPTAEPAEPGIAGLFTDLRTQIAGLDEQVRLLRAELAARDAEALRQNAPSRRPKRNSR